MTRRTSRTAILVVAILMSLAMVPSAPAEGGVITLDPLIIGLPITNPVANTNSPKLTTDVEACEEIDNGYYKCIMGCFEWSGTPTSCEHAFGSASITDWGVYFCPPAGEHTACTNNGRETDGCVRVIGKDSSENDAVRVWWSAQFTKGALTGSCESPQENSDWAGGWKVFSDHTGTGTYGAWVQAYIVNCHPPTC